MDRINVPELLRQLDGLYEHDGLEEARELLSGSAARAREQSDWSAELSVLSEQMGLSRRLSDRKGGLASVERGLELIRTHLPRATVSGATVMLNAATTLKAFGFPERAVEFFGEVEAAYSATLSSDDYRMAGLYNNYALALVDVGRLSEAETCYERALSVLEACPNSENEMAVTFCNMAYMYEKTAPDDERIDSVLERAELLLEPPEKKRDGYYAFTASKCASAFEYFGYFVFAAELKRRAEVIYAGN